MKLHRPYIPLRIRYVVAREQLLRNSMVATAQSIDLMDFNIKIKLRTALYHLFGNERVQLDHQPALVNRPFSKRTGKYNPDANDPRYLVYRTREDHDKKTRVRGDGAQLSDLALRRKNKRIAKRISTGKRPKYGVRTW